MTSGTAALYPAIEPHRTGYLPPADGHEVYFEVCGNPRGRPLLYLHGGPGSGAGADIRRLFDPQRYRAVLFDQRGAGRSRPHGSLDANTTDHLISDIERLRKHLQIESWLLFGGSWGSTLALAYAVAHPQRVDRLIVYGVFLCRQAELDRLYGPRGVAAALYPDAYAAFAERLPAPDADPVAAYAHLFDSADAQTRRDALRRWTALEKAVSRFRPDPEALGAELADEDYVLAHSLIENHYFRHGGFIDGDALLGRAGARLGAVPVDILAARYDLVCPPQTAFELKRALPHARLEIVPDAGHTWRDAPNTRALRRLLDEAAGPQGLQRPGSGGRVRPSR